ncbi:MAG: glycosyltransferase family 2 protein [Marinicaulis sp.]|nr:glycosyltransferase family 2 protein [Marinicaulis sp.]
MKYRIGVIIVNYKTPALVIDALDSLQPSMASEDVGVVVVDNASADDSISILKNNLATRAYAERFNLVETERNGGFSFGNNRGLAAIECEFVHFLNSDAIAKPGALGALASALENDRQLGAVTPKIVNSDGKQEVSRFRNHHPLSELVDGAQSDPLTKLFRFAETPIFPDDTVTAPDWASFASIMVRRSVIEQVGPMDEGFFLYYEDCDYCRRIKKAGYSIEYIEKAAFVHDAGGSTQLAKMTREKTRLPEYFFRSRNRYYRKYYGPLGPITANILWAIGRGLALLRGVFGRPAPALSPDFGRDIWIGWRVQDWDKPDNR